MALNQFFQTRFTLCVFLLIPYPNHHLHLFRNCRRLYLYLFRFVYSLFWICSSHCLFDSNFYTMKFSMFFAPSVCLPEPPALLASFLIISLVACFVKKFFRLMWFFRKTHLLSRIVHFGFLTAFLRQLVYITSFLQLCQEWFWYFLIFFGRWLPFTYQAEYLPHSSIILYRIHRTVYLFYRFFHCFVIRYRNEKLTPSHTEGKTFCCPFYLTKHNLGQKGKVR